MTNLPTYRFQLKLLLNGNDICLKTTKNLIFDMQEFKYWLCTSILDYFSQLVSPTVSVAKRVTLQRLCVIYMMQQTTIGYRVLVEVGSKKSLCKYFMNGYVTRKSNIYGANDSHMNLWSETFLHKCCQCVICVCYTPLSTHKAFILVPFTIRSYIIPTSIVAIQLKSNIIQLLLLL